MQKKIPAPLLEYREAAGLGQRELAEKAHRSQGWLCQLERRSDKAVTLADALNLSAILKVPPEKLFPESGRGGWR